MQTNVGHATIPSSTRSLHSLVCTGNKFNFEANNACRIVQHT